MRRIKLLVVTVAAMTMLIVVAAPAMAGDWDDHHEDFDGHGLFINGFEDFDEDFVELDDCELVSFYDDEAVLVCELDS